MVDLDEAVPKLYRWATANPLIRLLVIYGSYAKGIARPDSDLDIGIVIDSAEGDTDAFTTWTCEGIGWQGELTDVLGFDRVHLEWLDEEAPTPLVGAREAHVKVYNRDGRSLLA